MKSRTNIATEYTICGLTTSGAWRPFTATRFRSQETAERAMEDYKKDRAEHPFVYANCEDFKVVKRTVVTTIGEWEDV